MLNHETANQLTLPRIINEPPRSLLVDGDNLAASRWLIHLAGYSYAEGVEEDDEADDGEDGDDDEGDEFCVVA